MRCTWSPRSTWLRHKLKLQSKIQTLRPRSTSWSLQRLKHSGRKRKSKFVRNWKKVQSTWWSRKLLNKIKQLLISHQLSQSKRSANQELLPLFSNHYSLGKQLCSWVELNSRRPKKKLSYWQQEKWKFIGRIVCLQLIKRRRNACKMFLRMWGSLMKMHFLHKQRPKIHQLALPPITTSNEIMLSVQEVEYRAHRIRLEAEWSKLIDQEASVVKGIHRSRPTTQKWIPHTRIAGRTPPPSSSLHQSLSRVQAALFTRKASVLVMCQSWVSRAFHLKN